MPADATPAEGAAGRRDGAVGARRMGPRGRSISDAPAARDEAESPVDARGPAP